MNLKFRAWVIELQKMYDVQAINYRCDRFYFDSHDDDIQDCAEDISRSFSVGFKDCELMQSTGLRDKNGVEIFEGDVLKVCDDDGAHNELVFRDGQALVMNITYQDGDISTVKWALDCYYGFDDDENEYPIVIGNIYENPELIEAKNDD